MAAGDPQAPPAEAEPTPEMATEPAPGVPDYLASPNAVFDDAGVQWRYGKAPDYSKTRKVWEETRKMNHVAGTLPQLVENLVKNWEVEASFKPRLEDWRTIDHGNYSFAINGGPKQSAEHMLKVGTYNAIIAPNEFYSPENSNFESSHKTFKRMMPTFAWEVMEVYSGPPTVAFKWRHWGVMKNDYVAFNDKGEKVVAKAHGGPIEIFGVTVATVDDKVRLQSVDTWFDPLDMFRQIAPSGVVSREAMNRKTDIVSVMDRGPSDEAPQSNGAKHVDEHHNGEINGNGSIKEPVSRESLPKHISNSTGQAADAFVPHQGAEAAKRAEIVQPSTNGTPANDAANGVVEPAAAQGVNTKLEQPKPNINEAVPQSSADAAEGAADSKQLMQSSGEVVEKATLPPGAVDDVPRSIYSSSVTGDVENVLKATRATNHVDESTAAGTHNAVDKHLEGSAEQVHPHPHDKEYAVKPAPGEAIVVPADSEEARSTHEEMSNSSPAGCPFLMNRE